MKIESYHEATESKVQFFGILTITTAGLRQTPNGQFCVIAALPSFENIYYFCTLVARRKMCESRYHAKLLDRWAQPKIKNYFPISRDPISL